MIFNNYGELIDKISQYADRNDAETINLIPFWVNQVEDVLDRELRHPAAEKFMVYNLPAGQDSIPTPKQLLELRTLRNMETKEILYWRTPETIYDPPYPVDYPTAFYRRADRYVLNMPAKQPLQIEYVFYTTQPKLVNPGDNNLYLAACGDILMYMALAQLFQFIENDEEANKYQAMGQAALAQLQSQIVRESKSGSSLVFNGQMHQATIYF